MIEIYEIKTMSAFLRLISSLLMILFFISSVICWALPGKPLTLHFRNISVRDLLPIIAEVSGKNIIVSDLVKGDVSLNLVQVPWEKAFGVILETLNLCQREQDGVIYVVPSNISRDHAASLKEKSHSKFGDVSEGFFKISYAKAQNVADLISKNRGLLSDSGSVIAESRTNSLWVKDLTANLQAVRRYLHKIDVSVPQVLIESRIVYADENFARELGVKFGVDPAIVGRKKDESRMHASLQDVRFGNISFAIAKLRAGALLDAELSLLEKTGRGQVISNPKLITLDRETAYIEAGDEVPYQEKTSSGATNISFKKAVLRLKVTPEVIKGQQINLRLQLNQDKVTTVNLNGEPVIQTRQIQTQVLANHGQTVVLGGIYEESANRATAKMPFLSAIPIFGRLFRAQQKKTDRKELLIFVTPFVLY